MNAQEAKFYKGDTYVKSLCLIGDNDDFDRIVVEKDGTMTVTTFEDDYDEENHCFIESVVHIYKGITEINFK